jgi:hypothetical protein
MGARAARHGVGSPREAQTPATSSGSRTSSARPSGNISRPAPAERPCSTAGCATRATRAPSFAVLTSLLARGANLRPSMEGGVPRFGGRIRVGRTRRRRLPLNGLSFGDGYPLDAQSLRVFQCPNLILPARRCKGKKQKCKAGEPYCSVRNSAKRLSNRPANARTDAFAPPITAAGPGSSRPASPQPGAPPVARRPSWPLPRPSPWPARTPRPTSARSYGAAEGPTM